LGPRHGCHSCGRGSRRRRRRGCRCWGLNEALRLDWNCLFCGRGFAPIAAANPHQAVLPIRRAMFPILACWLRQVKETVMFHVKHSPETPVTKRPSSNRTQCGPRRVAAREGHSHYKRACEDLSACGPALPGVRAACARQARPSGVAAKHHNPSIQSDLRSDEQIYSPVRHLDPSFSLCLRLIACAADVGQRASGPTSTRHVGIIGGSQDGLGFDPASSRSPLVLRSGSSTPGSAALRTETDAVSCVWRRSSPTPGCRPPK
jgi:hypothetical protein